MDGFHQNAKDKAAASEAGREVSVASGSLAYQAEMGRDLAAREAVLQKGGMTADLLQRMESFGLALRATAEGSFSVAGFLGVVTAQTGGQALSPANGKTPGEALENAWTMLTKPGNGVSLNGRPGISVWDARKQDFVPGTLDAAKKAYVPKPGA